MCVGSQYPTGRSERLFLFLQYRVIETIGHIVLFPGTSHLFGYTLGNVCVFLNGSLYLTLVSMVRRSICGNRLREHPYIQVVPLVSSLSVVLLTNCCATLMFGTFGHPSNHSHLYLINGSRGRQRRKYHKRRKQGIPFSRVVIYGRTIFLVPGRFIRSTLTFYDGGLRFYLVHLISRGVQGTYCVTLGHVRRTIRIGKHMVTHLVLGSEYTVPTQLYRHRKHLNGVLLTFLKRVGRYASLVTDRGLVCILTQRYASMTIRSTFYRSMSLPGLILRSGYLYHATRPLYILYPLVCLTCCRQRREELQTARVVQAIYVQCMSMMFCWVGRVIYIIRYGIGVAYFRRPRVRGVYVPVVGLLRIIKTQRKV